MPRFRGQETDEDPLAAAPAGGKSQTGQDVLRRELGVDRQPRFRGQETDIDPSAQRAEAAPKGHGIMRTFQESLVHGGMLGLSDEVAGAAGVVANAIAAPLSERVDFDPGRSYAESRDLRREEVETMRRERPVTSFVGEVAGGIAGPGGAAASVAAGTNLAARMPGWLRAMAIGAGFGGGYGFAEGEGGGVERLKSAGTGAAVGGGVSAALYPVANLAAKSIQKGVGELKARFSPNTRAIEKVGEALQRDEVGFGRARARLSELGPQATLADVGGRSTKSLARATAGEPGPAMSRAGRVLEERAAGEGARLTKAISSGVSGDDVYALQEGILRDMKDRAGPLYQQAYEKHQSIMTPSLKRLLQSRDTQKALTKAARIVERERAAGAAKYLGAIDDELTQAAREAAALGKMESVGRPGVSRGFSLETWDTIKRGFDALLDSPAYRNELTGKLNQDGRSVALLKKALVKELDKATGGEKSLYVKARGVYAGDAEALEALKSGRKALTQDPEAIVRELADLSDAGKEAYRAGAARALRDIVEKTQDTASAARRIYGNDLMRKRLQAVLPDKRSYDMLAKNLLSERVFSDTKNFVLSGSQTAEKLAGRDDLLTRGAGAAAILSGSGGELLMANLRRRMAEAAVGKVNPQFAQELSKLLFSRNQAHNQLALDLVFNRPGLSGRTAQEIGALLPSLVVGQQTGKTAAAPQSGQKP